MKESRLFRIVYYLLDKGHATALELSKEFEVSVRTIYRDMDALSVAGIPIYAEAGRNGGIYLQDHYTLDKAILSDGEKQDILATLQSLSVIDNAYEKELLTKLSALFHIRSENWFEVDFSRWGSKTYDNTRFALVKQAVINHKVLSITYVSSYGAQSKRNIHPVRLLFKSKEWYVKAYCTDRQDFRIFKFNRIVELEALDEVFAPVDFPDTKDSVPVSYSSLEFRFSERMAYRVYDEFEVNEIEKQENGTLIVRTKMPADAWLTGYLLSFGAQVEVIEPQYLRKVLSDEAKKIYEVNKP